MTFKLLLPLLSACVAGFICMPAQATTYSVKTIVDGTTVLDFQGYDAPASAQLGDASSSVQLGFSPMPGVTASTSTSSPNTVFADGQPVSSLTNSQGSILYSFHLSGAANSTLNLRFDGVFHMAEAMPVNGVNQVQGPSASYGADNQASALLNLWTAGTPSDSSISSTWQLTNSLLGSQVYSGTPYSKYMSNGATLSSSTSAPLNQSYNPSYLPELSGTFSGSLPIALDSTGHANGVVYLQVSAVENASAFIDPYLYIDPAYLQAHPEAGLSFEPGVGNLAPVPEPTGVALWLAGLGALALWRRNHRKTGPH